MAIFNSKEVICGIYKITNIVNNKCYIGQSKNIHLRWNTHINFYKIVNNHFYNSVIKYGWDNFSFEVIKKTCNCILSLDIWERYFIKQFNATNSLFGYNITDGGSRGVITNQEIRDKKAISMKLAFSKIREANENNKVKDHYGDKNPMYGRKHSEKSIELMSSSARETGMKFMVRNTAKKDQLL